PQQLDDIGKIPPQRPAFLATSLRPSLGLVHGLLHFTFRGGAVLGHRITPRGRQKTMVLNANTANRVPAACPSTASKQKAFRHRVRPRQPAVTTPFSSHRQATRKQFVAAFPAHSDLTCRGTPHSSDRKLWTARFWENPCPVVRAVCDYLAGGTST